MPRAWYATDRSRAIVRRLSVFFLTLGAFFFFSQRTFFAAIMHDVQHLFYRASTMITQGFSRLFSNEESLTGQLVACSDRLREVTALAANSQIHAREVEEWRALFSYQERVQSAGIAARIIARQAPQSAMVMIDHGSADGIAVGAAVIIDNGILYGVVESVTPTTAVVRLTEDQESVIAATIFGKNQTLGLVKGNAGALLSMDFIPQDTRLSSGDVVVTSGLNSDIPQGLVIGIVDHIVAAPSAPFIQASIALVHDPRVWTAVLVLPSPATTL